MAFTLQRARIAGVPVRGVWRRAQDRIDEYVRRAREARNPDGSFSEDWFAVPPTPPRDDAWLIHTTGHVLEWLLLTLDDQAVRQEWIGRAADALADAVIRHDDKPLGKTSLAHAAHALLLYRQRVIDARRR